MWPQWTGIPEKGIALVQAVVHVDEAAVVVDGRDNGAAEQAPVHDIAERVRTRHSCF